MTSEKQTFQKVYTKMSESVGGEGTGIYLEPPLDDRLLVKWLESQATEVQAE